MTELVLPTRAGGGAGGQDPRKPNMTQKKGPAYTKQAKISAAIELAKIFFNKNNRKGAIRFKIMNQKSSPPKEGEMTFDEFDKLMKALHLLLTSQRYLQNVDMHRNPHSVLEEWGTDIQRF